MTSEDEMDDVMYANYSDSNNTILWSDLPEIQLSENLWKYLPPFILVFGTTGNVLSAVVMMRIAFRRSTIGPYFTVVAVSDTVVLYTGLFVNWLAHSFDVSATSVNVHMCKLIFFSLYWATGISAWLLVAVTWERVMAVSSAERACTVGRSAVRRALWVTFGITAVMFLINAHHFWTLIGVEYEYNGRTYIECKVFDGYSQFDEYVWPWINLSVNSLIPFILLLTGNIYIILRIVYIRVQLRKQMDDGRSSMATGRNSAVTAGRKIPSMTAVLLLVSFAFVITTAPYCLFPIIQQTHSYDTGERYQLGLTIVEIFSYVNNAINFWIYCISGTRFRKELFSTFSRRPTSFHGRGSLRRSYNLRQHSNAQYDVTPNCSMVVSNSNRYGPQRVTNGQWNGL